MFYFFGKLITIYIIGQNYIFSFLQVSQKYYILDRKLFKVIA